MRGGWLVGALAGSVLSVGSARAAEVVARGPSECPDSAELGFRVERGVGVALGEAPPMRFVVEMARAAGGYAGSLTVVGGSGTSSKPRTLAAASCEELADALAVAMTLALGAADTPPRAPATEMDEMDMTSSAEAPQEAAPTFPPASLAAADTARAAPSDAADDAEDDARAGVRPALSVAALLDAGSLPEPGLGAALGAELSWRRFQLRALGTLLFEQHTELGGGAQPAPGADLRLFAGSLLGCTSAVGTRALRLPVCLGFELGWLSGIGTGVVSPRSGSALWAAPRVDGGAQWCLRGSPVCWGATLTALTPMTRSRFALTDIGTVYRPPAVAGRLSIGVGVGFD